LHTFFIECTPDQIQAKLEFLEKNILLLKCECEVIELNSIKAQPELSATSKILISLISRDPDDILQLIIDIIMLIIVIILLIFSHADTIDVSWMPYDIKAEEYILSLVPAKVSKLSREKLRQSTILSKSNKSVLGSIYSVVNSAIKMNKYV